jgi:hypothetical protein
VEAAGISLISLPIQAGVDFPMYDQNSLPGTSFSCRDRVNGGFYADTAARLVGAEKAD